MVIMRETVTVWLNRQRIKYDDERTIMVTYNEKISIFFPGAKMERLLNELSIVHQNWT